MGHGRVGIDRVRVSLADEKEDRLSVGTISIETSEPV